jgi:hypothetical protein
MAEAASKVKRVIGLVRSGIQRHSGGLFASPRLSGSSHISQLNSKFFSNGTSQLDQLGRVNNSAAVQNMLVARMAKAILGVRSKSVASLGGVRNVATRELMAGFRSVSDRGLQRLGVNSRIPYAKSKQ